MVGSWAARESGNNGNLEKTRRSVGIGLMVALAVTSASFAAESSATAEKTPAPAKQTAAVAKNVVAEKLRDCKFLLNRNYKPNAKFYLCLFSASWCPPCRREMPRIAKIYAQILKKNPDIELIHFSCDQNDDKAMAWAKEHKVKFPVVKPKGGNPLNLRTSGIPHLFILSADGTVVQEGHPAGLFTEKKLRELK